MQYIVSKTLNSTLERRKIGTVVVNQMVARCRQNALDAQVQSGSMVGLPRAGSPLELAKHWNQQQHSEPAAALALATEWWPQAQKPTKQASVFGPFKQAELDVEMEKANTKFERMKAQVIASRIYTKRLAIIANAKQNVYLSSMSSKPSQQEKDILLSEGDSKPSQQKTINVYIDMATWDVWVWVLVTIVYVLTGVYIYMRALSTLPGHFSHTSIAMMHNM
jgi:hypothetical protein